jgi:hypothetical protein
MVRAKRSRHPRTADGRSRATQILNPVPDRAPRVREYNIAFVGPKER